MPRPVFVYGTLLGPALQLQLTGRTFPSRSAWIQGYHRGMVQGAHYPSLLPRAGSSVAGALLDGVDAPALALLDAYEGEQFERIEAAAETASGPERCWLWLLKEEHRWRITEQPFDPRTP